MEQHIGTSLQYKVLPWLNWAFSFVSSGFPSLSHGYEWGVATKEEEKEGGKGRYKQEG